MPPVTDIEAVPDSARTHWVNRAPLGMRPYLQLARLDRPVGYWLLALPGWIGLSFAGLSVGLTRMDAVWALLILIGAVAMRGAGCTYNDIVDQDLDAQVERTALRPLPAGTVTTRQAWMWVFAQVGVGFCVWLTLPWIAKGIALLALPLVAAYPFMKRITWFPQVWLGLTFNWAVLVAYAIKTGGLDLPVMLLYLGLMFWTVGYDTIYACQDIEDDALVGIKSTARKFGGRVKLGVGVCFLVFYLLTALSVGIGTIYPKIITATMLFLLIPLGVALCCQADGNWRDNPAIALRRFKLSLITGLVLVMNFSVLAIYLHYFSGDWAL